MNLLETVNWPKTVQELSNRIPLNQLHAQCIDFLCDKINQPWAIACSGGSDSLFLLLLIYGHFFTKNKNIYVLHYNHKLRGKESDEEEQFVIKCCKALNLPFICGIGNPLIQDKSESSLRNKRHLFFNEALEKIGSKILLLGHQSNDIAEMMLMRLARGSGTAGLCAPRPIHFFKEGRVNLRPLLNLKKEFLLDKLEELAIPYCTDSSNEGDYYFRNRIRRNVLPEWEAACTTAIWKGIERSRELLEEDDLALENWLVTLLDFKELRKGDPLNMLPFCGKPKALYRRILHKWLQCNHVSKHFNAKCFESLLSKVIKAQDFQINAGDSQNIIFKEGILILEQRLKKDLTPLSLLEEPINSGSLLSLSDDKFLEVQEINLNEELRNKIIQGEIDPNAVAYINYNKNMRFSVRLWQAGDRYQPLGLSGTRKLQDLFTDRKIPKEKRRVLPIVYEKDCGIAWCPGLPIAEAFRIDLSSICALKLTYK